MKKLLIGLTLLASISTFASYESTEEFIQSNGLEVCENSDIGKANFFSFTEIVSRANVGTTKYHLSGNNEYVNPKYVKPNFLECLLLVGEDCDKIVKERKIETPSNFESVVYEIVQDNSTSEEYSHTMGVPLGYGHGSTIQGMQTFLDLEVNAVAGHINNLSSKLIRLTGKFQGDSVNSRRQLSKLDNARFYCEK